MSTLPEFHLDPIDQAQAARRWETARRLSLHALQAPGLSLERANRLLRQLHDAYACLGDYVEASAALERIIPENRAEFYELAMTGAMDFARLSDFAFYRSSPEAKAGHTYEFYQEKQWAKAQAKIESARSNADTPKQTQQALALSKAIFQAHENLSLEEALAAQGEPETAEASPVARTGSVSGIVRFEDGRIAAGVTVTLGLKFANPFPDPSTHLDGMMHGVPEIGPIDSVTTVTDREGGYRFESVSADRHEFLAVTLDPTVYDVPVRFLQHGVDVKANETTSADLKITDWKSAAPRLAPSPFPERMEHDGRNYRRIHELALKNPFHYDFPRQTLSIALPQGTLPDEAALLLFSSADQATPQAIQLVNGGLTFFADLPRLSDRIFALYEVEGAPRIRPALAHLVPKPDADGKTAIIDTGAAQFRIAYGEGEDAVAPLVAVCGRDGVWRGEGRFRLPDNLAVLRRKTRVIDSGPLVLSVQIDYLLSNHATYSWIVTAHRDEAYLLVREISPELEGAAFEFSLREFSGGRGYLHWKMEGRDRHWSDLNSEERELARIQESVAWWLPPQGFAYGMAPGELDQKDFIAVFSRRRGEWIDRKFAQVCQGPGENRELDWPFPEMVGSTVSMITAHTDASGDAYFHFGFFDGERQWGILVSDVEQNDGPFKQLSAVQHKNSSPRLQDYKDWRLDEQDKIDRPFVMARRSELRHLREKKSNPIFAPYWNRIASGRTRGGPVAALLFVVENNPLAAWRKKVELVYAAQIRSKMILLGRDFGDCYSPVGARPVAPWAESYDLIAASGCFTPDEERLVRQFLVLMGHMHMEPDLMNWKFNSRNANFEADRTDLVGTVGLCFLGHPDAQKFIDHCLELTERSLEVYCTPGSGRWYENPACYYLHAAKCRMNLLFHLHRHGLFDATTIPRLKEFLRWGVLLLTPPCPSSYEQMRDGVPEGNYLEQDRVRRLPPIGDHAHIGPWVPDHYATAAKMYRASDPEFSDMLLAAFNEGGRDGGYLGNAPLLFCALKEDDLRPVRLPQLPSRRLQGFGALFRDNMGTDREFYLLLKQGPGGYRYHRTEGSIILFAGGRLLVYDGGEAGETWRHSTLSFYNEDMPLAAGHVERFHALPGLGFVQGVHPLAIKPGESIFLNDFPHHSLVPVAYQRYAEPNPVDVRSVFTVRDEYVVMHDDLRLDPEIPCRWHLQVVSDEHGQDAATGYLFRGRFGVDLQVFFPGQVFENEKVEQLPIHDYKATPDRNARGAEKAYNFKEQHTSVIRPAKECFSMRHLMVQAAAPKHYLAILRPRANGRRALEARALSQDGRNIGVSLSGENVEDVILFSRDILRFESEQIRFKGRYGAVVRRPNVVQLFLLSGVVLEAEGLRIISDGPAVQIEIKANQIEMTAEGAGYVEVHGSIVSRNFILTGDRLTVNLGRHRIVGRKTK